MQKKHQHLVILLTACLLTGSLLTACDGNGGSGSEDTDSGSISTESVTDAAETEATVEYKIRVVDYTAAPMKDIVVNILQGEEVIKMNVVKDDGTATFNLKAGDYTVTLTSPKGEYYYDTGACVLSETTTELTVVLYNQAPETMQLWAPSPTTPDGKQQDAYIVSEGATHAELVSGGEMTYFVFVPTRGGVYEINVRTLDPVDFGYYGMPINVFDTKLLDTVDNTVTLEVRNDSVNPDNPEQTGMFVFGVLPEEASTTDCIFTITRVGDPAKNPLDEPWQEYVSTQAKAYEGTHGATLTDIDVTNPDVSVVYNESDGYYHYGSADGPVVFIRIDSASPYLDSLVAITEKTRLGAYIYDDEGNFLRKESYHNMIDAYKAVCDENGVCPLTPELEYMIKIFGEKQQWWDFSGGNDIFGDKIVPEATAWLFICCYYQ